MIATLMFRISNVDLDQLDAFIHSPRLGETIRQGRESGVLKGGILAFTPHPRHPGREPECHPGQV